MENISNKSDYNNISPGININNTYISSSQAELTVTEKYSNYPYRIYFAIYLF